MWATAKKSRMVSQLQVQSARDEEAPKIRDIKSIQGRVIVLCLATWYFGFVLTQISLFPPAVWNTTFGIQMTYQYMVGPCFSLVPFGAAIGVVIAYFTMNLLSRRNYLFILNITNLVVTGCLQICNVPCLFIFRILQGVIAGVFMNFIPAYIGDLTPKQLGSRYGVYPQISVVLGVLVSFTVGMILTDSFDFEAPQSNPYVPFWEANVFWRVMFGIPLLPSLIQLFTIAIGYLPQSPYSLIIRNRRENARDVLALFYQQEYVNQILEERQKGIFEQSSNNLDDKVQWTLQGYFLGFALAIFQVLTGIASFVTQAGHVMSVSLNQPIFGLYTPILITISQLVGTLISIPLLKFIEWKTLTVIGGFSIAFFNALTGLFFYLYEYDENSFGDYAMTLSMITIMAFMFTFGITVGSSTWPYIGHMMPSKAITVAQIVNWLLAGFSIMCFSFNTYESTSPWIIIWCYTGITFVLSIFNWMFMIDIKGLSVRRAQLELAK